jgi:hypothetical protein
VSNCQLGECLRSTNAIAVYCNGERAERGEVEPAEQLELHGAEPINEGLIQRIGIDSTFLAFVSYTIYVRSCPRDNAPRQLDGAVGRASTHTRSTTSVSTVRRVSSTILTMIFFTSNPINFLDQANRVWKIS